MNMTMKQKRGAGIACVFLFGAFLLWIGLVDGMLVRSMPAHYVGFMVIAVGVAGMFGANIWKGGPWDPKNDPKPGNPDKPEIS